MSDTDTPKVSLPVSLGVFFIVLGGFSYALTYGEGYPTINGFGSLLVIVGIATIVFYWALASIALIVNQVRENHTESNQP